MKFNGHCTWNLHSGLHTEFLWQLPCTAHGKRISVCRPLNFSAQNFHSDWCVHNVFHASLLSHTKEDTIPGQIPEAQPMVKILERELWVIDQFVNSRWFRGKFQLKICWEDQAVEQDDWRDYSEILRESAAWWQELELEEECGEDPIQPMIEEYYRRHSNALRHDDPPHRCQAPLRHCAVRRCWWVWGHLALVWGYWDSCRSVYGPLGLVCVLIYDVLVLLFVLYACMFLCV